MTLDCGAGTIDIVVIVPVDITLEEIVPAAIQIETVTPKQINKRKAWNVFLAKVARPMETQK